MIQFIRFVLGLIFSMSALPLLGASATSAKSYSAATAATSAKTDAAVDNGVALAKIALSKEQYEMLQSYTLVHLKSGKNVAIIDQKYQSLIGAGRTVLMVAAAQGDERFIQEIIEYIKKFYPQDVSTYICKSDKHGKFASNYATDNGYHDVAASFSDALAAASTQPSSPASPLPDQNDIPASVKPYIPPMKPKKPEAQRQKEKRARKKAAAAQEKEAADKAAAQQKEKQQHEQLAILQKRVNNYPGLQQYSYLRQQVLKEDSFTMGGITETIKRLELEIALKQYEAEELMETHPDSSDLGKKRYIKGFEKWWDKKMNAKIKAKQHNKSTQR